MCIRDRFHGLTPAALRKSGGAVRSFAPLRIKVTLEDGQNMDCKISIAPHGQQDVYKRQTLYMDKMKGLLLQDKLVEYAYRQLSGKKAPTFHKLLFASTYYHDSCRLAIRKFLVLLRIYKRH